MIFNLSFAVHASAELLRAPFACAYQPFQRGSREQTRHFSAGGDGSPNSHLHRNVLARHRARLHIGFGCAALTRPNARRRLPALA